MYLRHVLKHKFGISKKKIIPSILHELFFGVNCRKVAASSVFQDYLKPQHTFTPFQIQKILPRFWFAFQFLIYFMMVST